MTAEELIAFEKQVADAFNNGQLRSPVHLSGGNEVQLIRIFKDVKPGDWVLSTWRSHYHALLKGVSAIEVMAGIRAGRSISLCFPEHRFLSSGIVAGCLPIAVGIAAGIKRDCDALIESQPIAKNSVGPAVTADAVLRAMDEMLPKSGLPHVWCFVGDMAARTGAFHEARQYAIGHGLPITFVIEDNGKSVLTDTEKAWGPSAWWEKPYSREDSGVYYFHSTAKFIYYHYDLSSHWPHAGAGKRVEF